MGIFFCCCCYRFFKGLNFSGSFFFVDPYLDFIFDASYDDVIFDASYDDVIFDMGYDLKESNFISNQNFLWQIS